MLLACWAFDQTVTLSPLELSKTYLTNKIVRLV